MELPLPPLDHEHTAELLEALPLGVTLEDLDGQVIWLNRRMGLLLGVPVEKLSGAKREQWPMALSDAVGADGELYRVTNEADGAARWLACISPQRLEARAGAGHRARFYQDISEVEQVRVEVDRLRQALAGQVSTDPLTGLLNRRASSNQLEAQISRSRRYGNALSIGLLRVVGGAEVPEAVVVATSRMLKDQLRWPDIIGRWGDAVFLVILPETDDRAAQSITDKVALAFDDLKKPGSSENGEWRIQVQVANWRKGEDANLLIARALQGAD